MKNIDVAIELMRVAAELSPDQKKYREFFEKKLKEYDANSPAELSDADKKKFFNEIDSEWDAKDESD